jgi:hypothetical protein
MTFGIADRTMPYLRYPSIWTIESSRSKGQSMDDRSTDFLHRLELWTDLPIPLRTVATTPKRVVRTEEPGNGKSGPFPLNKCQPSTISSPYSLEYNSAREFKLACMFRIKIRNVRRNHCLEDDASFSKAPSYGSYFTARGR